MLSIPKMTYLIFYIIFFEIFKSTLGLDEKCTKNSDCTTVNALCIDNVCTCDSLSYYNNTQCLQYATEYNAICYDDKQCSEWLGTNSKCRSNRCACAEGFRWFKRSCQKYVDKGEICSTDDECYNGYDLLSLQCSEGICGCSSDYYDRGGDCRRESTISGDCAITVDCRSSLYECVLGKCVSVSNSLNKKQFELLDAEIVPSTETLIFEDEALSCEYDDDCRDMANSLCDVSNKKCACNSDTHFLYEGNCVQGLSHCDDESDCGGNNTVCFRNSCICQQGFFLQNKICIAELGMEDPYAGYTNDSDCPIKPGKLVGSTCYCKNYWFNDKSNRNCIKTMIESSQSCLTNEWCSAMGSFSFCNSTTSTCQCSSMADFNQDSYYCELISNKTSVNCLRDTDCDTNESCVDEVCECSENFSRNEEDRCVPKIGGSCAINSCSHMENSMCIGGTCMCGDNYIGKETKCLEIADSLESPCEEQEQCENLDHAVCGESDIEYVTSDYNNTLRCVCEEGYTQVEEICYQIKKYGDPCMTEKECTSVLNRSYKCRNSQCQCNVGQSLKNGYCTSSANMATAGYLLWLVVLLKVYIK